MARENSLGKSLCKKSVNTLQSLNFMTDGNDENSNQKDNFDAKQE